MVKPKLIFSIIVTLVFIYSCDNFFNNSTEKKVPVAKALDKVLYSKDLKAVIPPGVSNYDSIVKASNYIDLWIKNQLILNRAEINLLEEEKNVKQQLEDYRAALLIYKYKQRFIEKNLDTTLGKRDIIDYYKNHANEFKLSENILKAEYIRISKTTPEQYLLKWWIWNGYESNKEKIDLYCTQHGAKREKMLDKWIFFKELEEKIPLDIEDEEKFLSNNKFYQTKDSLSTYFLIINDYKLVNDTTPINFVTNKIRSILINKKKLELLNNLEKDIYKDAVSKGEIKIFTK